MTADQLWAESALRKEERPSNNELSCGTDWELISAIWLACLAGPETQVD